jgi:ATP-dependent helicase/nuclease subunit A
VPEECSSALLSDVRASLWISASAGTGKTKSLIARIVALLLKGVPSSKILCLTYTKAAAAEMSSRLALSLQQLSQLSECNLKSELESLGCVDSYNQARGLYEKSVVDSQVSIQTIHGFCFKLLEKFPLETGLYPGIKLCDTYQWKQLMNESIDYVLASGHANLEIISEYTLCISDILKDHLMDISHFIDKFGDFENLYAMFFNIDAKWMNLSNSEIDAVLFEKLFSGNHRKIFAELAEVLFSGGINDIKKAEILQKNAINPSAAFTGAFLTEGHPFASPCSKQITVPNFSSRMCEITEKALDFLEFKKRIISAQANSAFFTIAREILCKFRELKASHHYLDFDDVILRATDLLKNVDWVMYKIDGGVDHLLIDEAQDTSPEQWEVIQLITGEFFSNYQSDKTILVVGDEKQSIYSFQGADVRLFDKMRSYFKVNTEHCGRKFHDVLLNKSYRTTGNILSFIDTVFSEKFTDISHITCRNPHTGVVEIVDLFENDRKKEDADEIKQLSAAEKLSSHIANLIEHAIKAGIFVESRNRTAQASDFLILFQRRNIDTMMYIIDALKEKGIPVTGVDKISLNDELVVEDLIALAEFAVFPLDDLMCARVLKSPFVDMTEDDLMKNCLARGDRCLWDYVKENLNLEHLQNYIDLSSRLSAYSFFMLTLQNEIREKFISRFGEKSLDVLNEFLALVMDYEKKNNPSVQGFLKWFRSFDHEIKRESFADKNAVRLMTVHASKGLQSPFVILADAHFINNKGEELLKTKEKLLFWNFSAKSRPSEVRQLLDNRRIERADENCRLLYVAMTRAEDFLYILGEKQKNSTNEKCWHSFVSQKLDRFTRIESNRLYRLGDYTYVAKDVMMEDPIADIIDEIPPWYYEKLPLQDENLPYKKKDRSMIYGDCVHLLLHEMPTYCDCAIYNDIADQFMEGFDLSITEKERAKAESLGVIKKFHFLFDAKSLSEVSFIHDGREGRIDRIAFRGEELWIVDFKTGFPQKNIPPDYITQLKLYRRAIAEIMGDPPIKTAVLWTQNLNLVECSAQD